ncbi:3-isopropylmalate dehydratase small subunit [Turneriella parva]|uniref:3-isopropylmalate dehydratase small subunit n=1 Tax=Turneriella parva (strain ATCC BAA-1111 / DSM 21527 / NCTC 11395 / H) TaxID=869212 RepID=I4B920_TURPD|nr:3-isopropylmalate dehydratase small subunit [Turneriella parva]AFM13777.1 3-isopropylmalate dehydratase small subunit [Turneriella parva DSM 21527]
MEKFKTVTSKAAPLDMPNVDTDQIIPKNFLKRVERTGFGQFLFNDWRFKDDGSENADFVLNKPAHKGAEILLARDNFGCGSSREHAPWALADYGFKVIVAPSFADIFYNNCFQNGILPLKLDSAEVEKLFQAVAKDASTEFTIDLGKNELSFGNERISFSVPEALRQKLLLGLDDIGWTLQFGDAISAHESKMAAGMAIG